MQESVVQRSSRAGEQAEVARARPRRRNKKLVAWLFVLPILMINVVVIIGPSISAFYYSMTDWSGVGAARFVGFENFRRIIFDDITYREAFTNNLIWLTFFLTVPFALALLAASFLAPIRRGGLFFRTALFIPYVLPSVIVASIWRNLLSPTLGVGVQLDKMGIRGLDQAWLGRPDTALLTVAFVDNWRFWGFLMVLFLAAMQNISPDLYEASRLDGATRWQEFRFITLPGIRPTIALMILMVSIWSFLVFDYVWILTAGGPAGSSEVLGTLVIKHAFNRFQAGYAAAIGLSMSFFAGIVITIFVVLRRRGWEV